MVLSTCTHKILTEWCTNEGGATMVTTSWGVRRGGWGHVWLHITGFHLNLHLRFGFSVKAQYCNTWTSCLLFDIDFNSTLYKNDKTKYICPFSTNNFKICCTVLIYISTYRSTSTLTEGSVWGFWSDTCQTATRRSPAADLLLGHRRPWQRPGLHCGTWVNSSGKPVVTIIQGQLMDT